MTTNTSTDTTTEPSADQPLASLDQYLQPMLAHRGLITALTAGTVVVGLIAGLAAPTTYRSTASILVAPISGDPTKALESGDIKVDMPTELRIATSQAVINAVADNLGAESVVVAPETLAASVTATSSKESRILDYAFEARTPELAQIGADTFAETYLAYRAGLATANQEAARTSINERIGQLKQRLSEVEAGLARSPAGSQGSIDFKVEKTSVEGELSALQTALADLSTLTIDAGEIIDQARRPESSEGLGLLQIMVGSLVAGLVLGAASAYLWAAIWWSRRRDRRASDRLPPTVDHQLRARTDPPAVPSATLRPAPEHRPRTQIDDRRQGRRAPDGPLVPRPDPAPTGADRAGPLVVEAGTDAVVGRLRAVGATAPVTALCVGDCDVSALSVAFDVADALHAVGARVLLVEVADQPILHSLLGVPAVPGLADVLAGRLGLSQAVRPIDGLIGVDVLTSGSSPDRPDLGAGPALDAVLIEARTRYHAVLIVAGSIDDAGFRPGLIDPSPLIDGLVVGAEDGPGPIDPTLQRRLSAAPAPVVGVISATFVAVDDERVPAGDG